MDKCLKAVFLDTSFLITLKGRERADHETAKKYFAYWYENSVKMFVSAICYAEYLAKDEDIPAAILNSVEIVSFNAEAAVIAGKLQRKGVQIHVDGVPRDALKDDIKIIASAATLKVAAIAHCDGNSMAKFIARAADVVPEVAHLKSILLAEGFNLGTAEFSDPELGLDFQ